MTAKRMMQVIYSSVFYRKDCSILYGGILLICGLRVIIFVHLL